MIKNNILLFVSFLLLLTFVNSYKPPHNKHDNHKHHNHKHNDNDDDDQRLNELEQKLNNNRELNEKRFKLIETNIDSINDDLNKIKEKQRELEQEQNNIHNDDTDLDDEFIKFKNETNQFHEMIQEQTNNLEDKLDNKFKKLSILIDTLDNNINNLNKTGLKSGTCPKPSACAGINLSTCTHDSQCSGTKKCCSNGCLLRVCLEPVNKLSPTRECPNSSTQVFATCLVTEDMCLNDNDCNNKDELCCSFGCGKKCIKISST